MTEQINPELVERMVALVRNIAACPEGVGVGGYACWGKARAIVAELPAPVDPDLLLAREVVRGRYVRITGAGECLQSVNQDDLVELALAAIKRVRAGA